jgi:hypothetical protein
MVYFIQAVGGGPIKIGFTDDIDQRIAGLRSHYGREFVLLRVIEGDRRDEEALHSRFGHLRFGRTEQFRPESDLLAFIDRPLFASNVPGIEEMSTARKRDIIAVPYCPEWKDWLSRAAAYCRSPNLAYFVDHATWLYAKENGFDETPPMRMRR